jgi:hypothetical protein
VSSDGKKAKRVVVTLEGRALTIELDISDDDLIKAIISSLSVFVKEGCPIKVIQTVIQEGSKSQSMFNTIVQNSLDLDEWVSNLRGLLRSRRQEI